MGDDESADSEQNQEPDESEESQGPSGIRGEITTRAGRVRQWSTKRKIAGGSAAVLLFIVLVLVALVPAGILGLVVNDSATFEAAPAAPQNQTVTTTGYELTTADAFTVKRHISPAGQKRTIIVINKRRIYKKKVDVQNESFNKGVFVTVSSPVINVAGSSQNPLATMSPRDILGRFESQLANGSNDLTFAKIGTTNASMLGQSTTVSTFETNVTTGGEKREIAVYVTKVRSEGDIVVAIGVHPTAFTGQRVQIFRLLHAVRHPV